MTVDLTSFLVQLAGDSELQSRYESDMEGVMTEAELSGDEKSALRSGDFNQIAAQLDFEGHSGFVPMCFCRFF